jgi:hypothetical protein
MKSGDIIWSSQLDELIQKLVIKKTGCGNNSSTTRF